MRSKIAVALTCLVSIPVLMVATLPAVAGSSSSRNYPQLLTLTRRMPTASQPRQTPSSASWLLLELSSKLTTTTARQRWQRVRGSSTFPKTPIPIRPVATS